MKKILSPLEQTIENAIFDIPRQFSGSTIGAIREKMLEVVMDALLDQRERIAMRVQSAALVSDGEPIPAGYYKGFDEAKKAIFAKIRYFELEVPAKSTLSKEQAMDTLIQKLNEDKADLEQQVKDWKKISESARQASVSYGKNEVNLLNEMKVLKSEMHVLRRWKAAAEVILEHVKVGEFRAIEIVNKITGQISTERF